MVVDVGVVKNYIKPKADSTLRNMRKDDLIKYIRCLENNYNVAVSFNENQVRYIESLGVLLRWIPIAQRLPEVRVPVLTYGRKGAVGIGFIQPTSVAPDGKVYFYARYGDSLPTHWMPLPEPPKEVEDGN